MQAFFRGTVVLLYFISHYLGEPIFIAACLLPVLYGVMICLFLRFGALGRMVAARDRAKRFVKRGVISGDRRALFYKKCIRAIPPDARAAYALFAEGKSSASELALSFTRSIKVRGELLKGGMRAVGVLCALAVFLAFYFGASVEEALLRSAICAFIAALNGVALHFVLYASLISAEKAACALAGMIDASLLREKREENSAPYLSESQPTEGRASDEETLRGLRSLLRDLDARDGTRSPL